MRDSVPGSGAVAIVGMAGRFPAADDVDALWSMLLEGTEAVRRFTPEELREAGVPERHIGDTDYRPYAADLAGVEDFDAAFFGITPAEARLLDPQHRFFLECVWAALEDAGTAPRSCQGSVGVFGSTSMSSYLLHHVLPSAEFQGQAYTYPVLLGNDKDFLATRVSYRLGLRGPSMTVQAGCSSSLVAVDLARSAVLSDQCEVAVAGGVSIFTPQTSGYLYQQGGTFSADGHCRPFDAAASGMVRGSGCAVVVLKRLDRALADRDRIYAVIAGSAVNNDGSVKAGYTAPGVAGQVEVIRQALAESGVPASEIGYVEAHGTGTFLGDPVEVAALAQAYSGTPGSADAARAVALGSIKANIGHLDAAAGVTGLVKAALVLRHQVIPPQVNFTEPNPELGLAETPFTIHTRPYHCAEQPLRAAAVTSLGIGGTNAHCVLTAPPSAVPRAAQPTGEYLLLLSGPDEARLAGMAGGLADHLEQNPGVRLDDLAYTLATGREPLERRGVVLAATREETVAALRDLRDGRQQVAEDSRARAWLGGADAHGLRLGEVREARKIWLPGMRFHRVRHWIDAPVQAREASQARQQSTGENLLTEMVEAFCSNLGVCSVTPDDDYFAVGGDSLLAVALVSTLRRQLGIPLTYTQFTRLRTPQQLAAWCEAEQAGALPQEPLGPGPGGALHLVKDGTPGQEIFLVHPSGGTTLFAHALASHSTDASPLYGISYPASLDKPLSTITAMAEHYVSLIRTVRPHGPYRIGGYSLGGSVALEMAHLLTEAGQNVEQVILFDTLPPQAHLRAFHEDEFLAVFPSLLALTLGLPQPAPGCAPPRTPEEAIEVVRQPDWTPATVRELRSLYDTWRNSAHALSTYRPRRYQGAVHLLAAAQPLQPGSNGLPAAVVTAEDWQAYLPGNLNVTTVPGNHFSMFRPDNLPALAAAYDQALLAAAPSPLHVQDRPASEPAPGQRPQAWLFAGQGIQHPGMGQGLLARYPELVREADDILGYSTTRLCAGDPDRPLSSTTYAQPAIYLINALAARQHLEDTGREPGIVLGHSLGEYNALETAGVFSFGDGLRLVAARAAAMDRVKGGGMLAVVGIPEPDLLDILTTEDFQYLELAAANTPLNQTVAGPHSELERLTPALLAHGARAVRPLNVSGPFHSRYMRPAADEFSIVLRAVALREPAIPVLANTTAQPHAHGSIPAALTDQLCRTVRWRQSVERAISDLDPGFHEIGSQRILTPMTAQIQAVRTPSPARAGTRI
ncbi:beta-ketoacyl synthase N-terminal-like domain-containing protein [Streptomyces sp. TX20-6-3]|uniref:beta-ketoacyl synthase N-terminal-like domain-containing protein n=1 Tax=Streptomyces sp. TX20-6-3 TaxID=3028705 RepID=UPI0029BB38A0|nr:beta-ketoacyl synthase N-terminal-like domain-containing protein [Streptomyces sp. TX20-6-3]MDX2565194.1 beta-ketoacyl synthase N-terminal-like domain-containing protein [Streptomyces sp. TX20-6-3]